MSKLHNIVRRGSAALVSLGVSAAAFAEGGSTIPSAAAQISEITAQQSGYATVMFALALTAVGILVGVKWIKRGRGAA